MLSERNVHIDVKNLLLSGNPFQYAHLIKFERPSRPNELSGKVSTSAQRYTYLTDASRDVVFDDLSKDHDGNYNGPQNYIANKVLNITEIQEAVEAKADTCSITLDGNGIGGAATGDINIVTINSSTWDITCPSAMDLVHEGFREGDKVTLSGDRTGSFNIHSFRAGNIVRLKKIDDTLVAGSAHVTIVLDSEEIKSILLDKNIDSYASFINREVFIYRAYFEDGKLVGETPDSEGRTGPILIFRGIINNVSFEEDDSSIKVQWGVSSHWGDFSQVKGRITSDEFHRALDQNGIPQPYSALKPIYAYDKGFMHSDTSLNMIATYTVMVDKTTIKAKNGFLGIGAKTKVKTVQVEEGRNTQLNVQLQNKSIPIIYGVRNTAGSPIFADTLKNDSSTVYIAYALSEGQIGGLYDLYIDGKSLICKDKEDLDARGTQTSQDTVDVICRGRADRGDVLGGTTAYSPSSTQYYDTPELRKVFNLIYNRNIQQLYKQYQGVPTEAIDSVQYLGTGVIHGESVRLTSPQDIELEFFSGTESQAASSQLTTIAAQKNFKVQNDYWLAQDNAEYWGPNHRLIDTAYVVGKFKIKEGETTIPEIEYVVRGKVCECYNYDYSFTHDDKMTGESPDNFLLGDTVTLNTGQNVTIIDKWSFARPDGIIETRFRYSEDPELNYDDNGIPSITRFSMSKGGSTWTMVTHNWALDSGIVPAAISAPVDTIVDNPDNITVTFPPTPGVGGPGNWSIIDGNQNVLKEAIIGANISSNTLSSNLV